MSVAEVLNLIQEKRVQFIDFRFTDSRGKEQHVSVPASVVGADTFDEGEPRPHRRRGCRGGGRRRNRERVEHATAIPSEKRSPAGTASEGGE